jgi:hypothetical protein
MTGREIEPSPDYIAAVKFAQNPRIKDTTNITCAKGEVVAKGRKADSDKYSAQTNTPRSLVWTVNVGQIRRYVKRENQPR